MDSGCDFEADTAALAACNLVPSAGASPIEMSHSTLPLFIQRYSLSNYYGPGLRGARGRLCTRDHSSACCQLLSCSDRGIRKHYVHQAGEARSHVALICKHGALHVATNNLHAN